MFGTLDVGAVKENPNPQTNKPNPQTNPTPEPNFCSVIMKLLFRGLSKARIIGVRG